MAEPSEHPDQPPTIVVDMPFPSLLTVAGAVIALTGLLVRIFARRLAWPPAVAIQRGARKHSLGVSGVTVLRFGYGRAGFRLGASVPRYRQSHRTTAGCPLCYLKRHNLLQYRHLQISSILLDRPK
jgi:hypothetical protein